MSYQKNFVKVDSISADVKTSALGKKNTSTDFKVVVWNKTKKLKWSRSEKSKSKAKHLLKKDSYYVLKRPLVLKADRKNKDTGTLHKSQFHASTSSNKAVKRKRIQFSKPRDYKKFIQSYIHIKQISESEQMKENGGDANLKWLLDFKVDTLFQQEQEGISSSYSGRLKSSRSKRMAATQLEQSVPAAGIGVTQTETFDPSNPEHAFTVDLGLVDDVANFEQVECPTASTTNESTQIGGGEAPTIGYEFRSPEITFDEQGKPRCTYTDLIERALTESGGLTVSEIYQWISDHYSYFSPTDDRWKNSVRHNLSINPYFHKGDKARSGAGHLWTISEESRALRPTARKKESEYLEIPMSIENDTDRAVANILGQYHLAKTNMEGGQTIEVITTTNTCPDTDRNSTADEPSNNSDEPKLMEIAPGHEITPVYIEYANNDFNTEFTIDLSSLHFPDPSSINFDDLMPGGLIVIRTNDEEEEAKEKAQFNGNTNYLEEYMTPAFSELRNESLATETERVSGQLISEALTQGLESEKHDNPVIHIEAATQQICREIEYERIRSSVTCDTQDYMSLDSIDPIALQEVMQGESTEDQYQLMNTTVFEPKDLGYCNFESEVTL